MNLRLVAMLACLAALAGCASYVNIPPDSSEDIAINAINAPPTPGILRTALDYVLIEHPAPQTPFGVRLPVEANDSTWDKVLTDRPGAVPFSQLAQGDPVYDVRSIRIRGADAWVDIVVPQTIDNRPLVEVRLEGRLSGWRVTSMRHWSASVIRQRETSGQYGSTPPEPARPIITVEETPATGPTSESEDHAAPPDSTPLAPIRPVKHDGGG